MLSSLQSRLLKLESAIAPSPLKPIEDVQSGLAVTSEKLKKNRISGSSAANRQTLRSRSFKVMRHLINVVDVSHIDQPTFPGPKRPRKETKTSEQATSFQKLNIPQPMDRQAVAQGTILHVATSFSPKIKAPDDSKSTSNCHSPRIFHPKRPRKDAKTLSQPKSSASHPQLPCKDVNNLDIETLSQTILSASHPQLPCKDVNNLDIKTLSQTILSATHPKVPCNNFTTSNEPTGDARTSTNATQKMPKLVASPSQQPNDMLVKDKVKKEVFLLNTPEKKSDRFELLKLDPVVSDLLPLSGNDYTCFTTNVVTQIKNLPRASSSLVKQQTLGVWEWREGTSTAKLYEYYRFSNSETTIDKRRFQYVGWAWKGKTDQQPPKIQDLPNNISQGCNSLRWYWFKDLWLLFYFD